jgi:hypothetical protein
MRKVILASVATLALIVSVPAMAQTANSSSGSNSSSSAGASAGAQAGSVAGAIGNSSRVSTSNTSNYKSQKQAPGVAPPGLAAGGLSCRGSMSVGVSGPGFGFGFGSTTPDDECERRQWGSMFAASKDPYARRLAWAIMRRSGIVAQAMQELGEPGVAGVALTTGAVRGVRTVGYASNSGRAARASCTLTSPSNPTLCLD